MPLKKNKKSPVEDARQHRYWDRRTGGRGPDHPVVRAFVRQRLKALKPLIPFSEMRRLLDVGSGGGWALGPFKEEVPFVVGADRSFELLSESRERFPTLVRCDTYHLPFPDRSFDIVSCWELLHHVSDIETAVREMVRVSRRYITLFEPNRYHPLQFLFGLAVAEERGTLRSTLKLLTTLLRDAGTEIVHAGRVGVIFPNKLPAFLLPLCRRIPFRNPLGISCMVVARK